ncbi:MAG: sulfide-dependent adenosine diphosphate thiazole synthase [Candidatus Omnitrophica bacterium]|nr:sulfide-dependent adenosine diphosphate thiazole synthase [Candidatus Omnitrophota bacterium]
MSEKKIFSAIGEKEVTQAIVETFSKQFKEYVESDVIIIGAGPSGLMAGKELAKKKIKTFIIERNNYLGGGFWIGGYLMNKLTVRAPGDKVLKELGIPYEKYTEGLFVADGPHACSKLIAAACDAGVKFANMTIFDDLVLHENNRVGGVVVNWTPVTALPREITCVDPVGLECKVVVDATGHDACVVRKLSERGLIKVPGFGAMWVEHSEDLVVEYTKELYPGLVVCGMSTTTSFGLPRMGPTFGAMLLSGKKCAEVVMEVLQKL